MTVDNSVDVPAFAVQRDRRSPFQSGFARSKPRHFESNREDNCDRTAAVVEILFTNRLYRLRGVGVMFRKAFRGLPILETCLWHGEEE